MGADIAEQVTPVPMSSTLGQTLTRAAQYAQEQSHAEVALDHLLLALTEDDDARQVLTSSGVIIEALQTDVSQQIGRIDSRLAPGEEATVSISEELRRILNAAAVAARAGRRAVIDGAIVLAAIIGDARTSAAGLLRAHGLTFEAAINVIRQASQSSPRPPTAGGTGEGQVPHAPTPPPAQTTSPTSDILAQARNQIASRKAAGYSDQVAAKKTAERAITGTDENDAEPQIDRVERDVTADETEAHGTDLGPPEESEESKTEKGADVSPVTEEQSEADSAPPDPSPPPPPDPMIAPPAPPPIAAKPPPTLRPPFPPAASQSAGQGWAPPPSGRPANPAGPPQRPPRGAPPPIPAGMPSRPPAPVPTGNRPSNDRHPPDAATPTPPFQRNAHREPPWSGAPPGSAGERQPPPTQKPPSSGAPLPSPQEVFATNSRACQQPERPKPPSQRERPPGEPPDRMERKRARSREPSLAPTVLPGQLIENVPRRMRVGITSPVEVRIAKSEVKAISEGLDANTTHRHDIQVTKAMSVRLRAPEGGFFIETASPETQWIENALGLMADDYARWRWTVTPKTRGKRRLQLIVSARTVGPDGLAAETALPDQIIEIKVSTNYSVVAKRVAGWTVAAVLGGLLAQFGAQIWTALEPFVRAFMQQ